MPRPAAMTIRASWTAGASRLLERDLVPLSSEVVMAINAVKVLAGE